MRDLAQIEGDLDTALQGEPRVKNKRCIELHGELDKARDEIELTLTEIKRIETRLLEEAFGIPPKVLP